jgi:hypothetical protein
MTSQKCQKEGIANVSWINPWFHRTIGNKKFSKVEKKSKQNHFSIVYWTFISSSERLYTHNFFMAIHELKFQGCCVLGLGSKVCNVIL